MSLIVGAILTIGCLILAWRGITVSLFSQWKKRILKTLLIIFMWGFIAATVGILDNVTSTIFTAIVVVIYLFIYLTDDDDWRKRKKQFGKTKLKVKQYLATGVIARRPLPN